MSRHSATRRNKGRWKELTEQANRADFSFFLNLSRIFPKGTSRNQTFYFSTIFIYFSLNKDHKICNHKNWHLQLRWDEVYRNSASSLKSVQNPWQLFSLFSLFYQFWWDQTGLRRVWVESKWRQEATVKILDFYDKRAKSYACFTEGMSSYVFSEGTTRRRRQLGQSVPKLQHRSQDESSMWLTAIGIHLMM